MNMRLIGAKTIKDVVPEMVDASNIHTHVIAVPGDRLYDSNCPSFPSFVLSLRLSQRLNADVFFFCSMCVVCVSVGCRRGNAECAVEGCEGEDVRDVQHHGRSCMDVAQMTTYDYDDERSSLFTPGLWMSMERSSDSGKVLCLGYRVSTRCANPVVYMHLYCGNQGAPKI